jgi:ABC-2 type transport system ATP-binding protein
MLRLENVRKCYGPLVAVDDLSLDVPAGEFFGLLGPNGAGKSSMVNMAVGLLRPDRGQVIVNGAGSPSEAHVRAQIGVAPQTLAIYEDLTGEENLQLFGRLCGLGGSWLSERVNWSLDFVGLSDRRRSLVKTYSGGMKRRLNLAIAVLHQPKLLLLDEPTVGVDPQSRNAIFENALALKREGTTIIYTTHYMEEAQRLCDRVAIMDKGKVLDLDTVDALIRKHGGRSVLIGETDQGEVRVETDDPVAALASMQGNGRLKTFHVERPNLESVFLRLTGRSLRD